MGKQGVFLENSIYSSPFYNGGTSVMPSPSNRILPEVGFSETADQTKGSSLPTTAGTQESDEYILTDVQADTFQGFSTVTNLLPRSTNSIMCFDILHTLIPNSQVSR